MAKVTDEMRDTIRTLYTKALLPCEAIGQRLGLSRQTVNIVLRKLGVDTKNHKHVVRCSQCGQDVIKTRAELRKYERHFCDQSCRSAYLKKTNVTETIIRNNNLRALARDVYDDPFLVPGIYDDGSDILLFRSNSEMLEWMRTGIAAHPYSAERGDFILAEYKLSDV